MAQETLIEGMFRSLKANRTKTFLIIGFVMTATAILHFSFPTVYESNSLLRVLSTEQTDGQSLAASMNGILSQAPVVQDALKGDGLEEVNLYSDLFALEDAGPGLVKLAIRNANPSILQPLGDAFIKTLSEKFLGFSTEVDRFEMEALDRKKQVICEKIGETRREMEKSSVFHTDTEEMSFGSLEEGIRAIEVKLEEGRQKLSTIPKIRVFASQEHTQNYQNIKDKLKNARANLNELLLNYREKHPRVIKANTEIAQLESALRNTSNKRDREEPNPEYDVVLREVTEKEAVLAQLKARLELQRSASTASEGFQIASSRNGEQRLKALENMHDEVVLKLEQLQLKNATALGKIQVLRKDPEGPKPLGFSFLEREIIGMLSGSLLAVILLYTPLPRPEVPTKMNLSNAALMGFGPTMEQDVEAMRRIMRIPFLASSKLGAATEALPAPHDERLIVLNEPHSRLIQPFRALLSNLQIQLSESGARVLMISSSREGMGRTTLVSNLAILLCQEGYSVVLVDANFRRPSLHRVFEGNNNQGLAQIRGDETDEDLIQKTFVHNLSMVPSGPVPPNPFEILGTGSFKHFLDILKRKYELVLIDTPSLLDYPDARIIATQVSGVVFLNREGEPENDVRSSREFLQNLKTRVLGFVQA